ncbi:FAD-dependent oxidoreductase [Rudaeicoccus suwonensis]|uniref:ferredoxin--NADP(+) reductase n=1 Tax=Rudaeicoccus suwonensis TaxID=657409 RepID=A0A561E3J8_9MICO|nr:FAD-dependent oxidoreductase [Rudaeicoccus suwonensis]TWE10171.1 ferredoxin--NADP+ reductase [Rudaeicoccus suwonensis]
MAFVITQSCCADASCVSVCPVNCIHPTPDEPDFGTTDTLYVDPSTCIDCGACADACPVKAIQPADALSGAQHQFIDINAQFYETPRDETVWTAPAFTHSTDTDGAPLRIAIVGSGPAASYTAKHLLTTTTCEVAMFERLPVPGGLLREGVAPDHGATKAIADTFRWVYRHHRTSSFFNVEVGTDVSLAELQQRFHAVVYGVGARGANPVGFPGEDDAAVVASGDVVGWYNGRPVEGSAAFSMPLNSERVVIVGNGNVALDIARILLAPVDSLHETDVPSAVLDQLRHSRIREVVVMGRRGPQFAAFTRPELLMLPETAGCEVVVEARLGIADELAHLSEARHQILAELPVVPIDWAAAPPAEKRIVLAFHTAIDQVVDGQVQLRRTQDPVAGTGEEPQSFSVGSATVVLANGFRVSPQPDLPYDEAAARIPHRDGRVLDADSGEPLPGVYVVGWTKRGAHGGIGANRRDAEETVDAILADGRAGLLAEPTMSRLAFRRMLSGRTSVVSARRAMAVLDREEAAGRKSGRSREKFVSTAELLAASRLVHRGRRTG